MKQNNKLKFIKYFDSFVERTLFILTNKTNNFFNKSSKISKISKLIIGFICLLFFYLFYLLIPTLYDKTWVQNTIENKLLEDFRINFSISSDISYNILPSPHFLIKDSQIIKENNEKTIQLSEIKNLKVFINKNFFWNKEKLNIKNIIIDKANFSISRNDFKLLNNSSNNKFSNKKIKIKNSNIFFKDNTNETIAIIKISKAFLFFDNFKLLNFANLKGEVFKIPFTFDLSKKIYSSKNKETNISAKTLQLNIYNESKKKNNNLIVGKNTISILNSKIYTKYDIGEDLITFESDNSKIKNSKIDYKGELSINPFDLKLDVNLENYQLSKLINANSIFAEFIKTKLLFNKNISLDSTIISSFDSNEDIFDLAKINFNIANGEINIDQTKLINKEIGFLEIINSNLFYENDKLILKTDIIIDVQNSENLFTFLRTAKKARKPIKNIFINLNYDFSNNQIKFNNFRIDNMEDNDEMLRILDGFNANIENNLNNSRHILNKLFFIYEG